MRKMLGLQLYSCTILLNWKRTGKPISKRNISDIRNDAKVFSGATILPTEGDQIDKPKGNQASTFCEMEVMKIMS